MSLRTLSRWFNPLAMQLAGTRIFPLYGVLQHRGRRSGKAFRIPVVVTATPDGLLVPMPWGEGTDWYRNVVAAGGCVIRWKGRDFPVKEPRLVSRPEACPYFGMLLRAVSGAVGMQSFLRLRHARD